jgi:transcriptional regulator with XRE-family HTH domain
VARTRDSVCSRTAAEVYRSGNVHQRRRSLPSAARARDSRPGRDGTDTTSTKAPSADADRWPTNTRIGASCRSPSDETAARVREVRKRRGLTVADLAERCAGLGAPELTAQALYKLEGQRESQALRPRPVTVDELLVLALALNCPPLYLLVQPDGPDEAYPVTATVSESRRNVAAWVAGEGPMLRRFPLVGDIRLFYSELPEDKFSAITGSKKDEATS